MPNKIWHPNDINGAHWFISGSQTSATLNWQPIIIPKPGSAGFLNLPESMKKILQLDNPDLIATIEIDGVDVPVISIEITTTTPQSQHAKQRVPRLVAAAETGVPAIYIIPERKISGGSSYRLGNDLYYGINIIRDINNVPVFIYHYPDRDGTLIHDRRFPNQPNLGSPSIQSAFRTIDTIIRNKVVQNDIATLYTDTWIQQEIQRHNDLGNLATVRINNYTTLTEIPTTGLNDFLVNNTQMGRRHIRQTLDKLPDRILSRDRTLVFRPGGRLFAHAGDPYVGMLAFFDYAFCRVGNTVEDRRMNLIHMPVNRRIHNITDEFCPSGYNRYWEHECPFRNNGVPTIDQQFVISHHLQYGCVLTKIKPLRILGYFSDMIVFQDAMLVF